VKTQLLVVLSFAALLASADGLPPAPVTGLATNAVTNIVSDVVTIKRWSRQYVLVNGDGSFNDPSGLLVKQADETGRTQRAEDVKQVTDAAYSGMTNSMQRVYDLTNRVPSRGVSLRFSMKPSQDRANFFAYIPQETSDGTNDLARYFFSNVLAVAPKIQRRYRNGTDTVMVEGEWQNYTTNGVTVTDTQGVAWQGCNICKFARPAWAVGRPLRPNKHPVLGHPVSGLDFAGAMVFVDGLPTLTGYVTNGTARLYFDNGAYKGTEAISE